MPIIRWNDMAQVQFPLSVLADNYIANLSGLGRSRHTIDGFTRILRSFEQFVVEMGEKATGEDLCPESVAAFRAHLIAKKYKLSSVRHYIQILKAWSAYLAEEGVYKTDPLAKRGLLPKLPKSLPKFLSDEERVKIIEHWSNPTATSSRNLAIFLLGLDTGLRVSELAALKLADVDFRQNEVRVWGKGAKERRAGFGKKTASRVRSYVDFHRRRVADEHLSEDRMFLCHTGHSADGQETIGEPLSENGIKLIFRRLSARLALHVSPHMMRHTFAHDFLANGGSVADLQRLLGHESPETSLWYARVFNSDALERQKTNSVVDKQFQRSRQRV